VKRFEPILIGKQYEKYLKYGKTKKQIDIDKIMKMLKEARQ